MRRDVLQMAHEADRSSQADEAVKAVVMSVRVCHTCSSRKFPLVNMNLSESETKAR